MHTNPTRLEVIKKTAESATRYFGEKITEEHIRGKSHKRIYIYTRVACAVMLLTGNKCTLAEAGNFLGGRDHTTVINYKKQFQKLKEPKDKYSEDMRKMFEMFICPAFNVEFDSLYKNI